MCGLKTPFLISYNTAPRQSLNGCGACVYVKAQVFHYFSLLFIFYLEKKTNEVEEFVIDKADESEMESDEKEVWRK